jgi:aquaporin Z
MKKLVAELIGTGVLVFVGVGSAVIAGAQIGYLGIALAFGLTLLALVYAIGPVSGCHVNPAVSIAMLVAGRMSLKDAVGYIVAQCVGAVIAAGLLLLIASGRAGYSLAANGLGQNGYDLASPMGYSLVAGALAEILLTAMFIFVIFGSLSKDAPKGFAGIPIGIALGLANIVAIPITGASINPARSIGPAVFVGGTALAQLWLFILAPVIGGTLAALAWKYFEPASPA